MHFYSSDVFRRRKESEEELPLYASFEEAVKGHEISMKSLRHIKAQEGVDNWRISDGYVESRNREMKVPEEWGGVVRSCVYDIFAEKKNFPTVTIIHKFLTSKRWMLSGSLRPEKFKWSRSTLFRFMLRLGFGHSPRQYYYEGVREREDILEMRANYLQWISQYRKDNYIIFFQEETWANQNFAPQKMWTDGSTGTRVKVSSGVGSRCIISHIGSKETGLLDGAFLLFRGKKSKKTSDYHTEMNSDVFLHWMDNKVFPRIQKISSELDRPALCVLDRASYHTTLTDFTKPVNESMCKGEIAEKIRMWGNPHDEWPLLGWEQKVLKGALLSYAKSQQPAVKYRI